MDGRGDSSVRVLWLQLMVGAQISKVKAPCCPRVKTSVVTLSFIVHRYRTGALSSVLLLTGMRLQIGASCLVELALLHACNFVLIAGVHVRADDNRTADSFAELHACSNNRLD